MERNVRIAYACQIDGGAAQPERNALHLGFVLNDGSPLRSVEVRIDNGAWQAAKMDPQNTQFSWKFFTYEWNNLTPGEHTIVSRATDGNGVVQPEDSELSDKKTLWENNGQLVRKFTI
jgi:hypothetical protein